MAFGWQSWVVLIAVPLVAWSLAVRGRGKAGLLGSWRGYFLAGGTLGSARLGVTNFGTNLTFTSIFLILSFESTRRGWWVLSIPVFWIAGTLLLIKYYGRLKPHIDAERTLHKALGDSFRSSELRLWASIWTIVAFVGTVALEFYGGILLISWTGVSLFSSVGVALGLAFVVSAFTVMGGLRGVSLADIVLDLASLGTVLILLWFAWPVLWSPARGQMHMASFEGSVWDQLIFVASMAVLFVPFQFCTLDTWQRLLSWKDRKEKSPWAWLLASGVALAIAYCVPIMVGIAVHKLGLKTGAELHPLRAFVEWSHLGPWLLGLCFAGFAGALLSTADELLNCSSLSLLFDAFRIARPDPGSDSAVRDLQITISGKFYTAVFAVIAAIIAVAGVRFGRAISEIAVAVFSAQVVFSWPLAAALFTPNTAPHLRTPAVYCMVVGFVSSIALVFVGWALARPDLTAAGPIGGFVLAGVVFCPYWVWRHRKLGAAR